MAEVLLSEIVDVVYAVLGDVGGTNVRLVLKKLYLSDANKGEVVLEQTVDSRSVNSFEEALKNFLSVSIYFTSVSYIYLMIILAY